MKNYLKILTGLFIMLFVFSGCAHKPSTDVAELQDQLQQRNTEIKTLQSSLKDAENRAEKAMSATPVMTKVSTEGTLFPPQANPGQCFARVFIPPQYSTGTEQVLKKEASERIEIIPARYEAAEEQILVKEASVRIEEVPAQYEMVDEKIMVKPAHTTWKKGRGLIEKVDNGTGEIMCLVDVPAQYKTVTKRVLKAPATTRQVEIPAQYKTVKVRKIATPPQENRIQIPAQYDTITKSAIVSEGHMEWKQVLCETNLTGDLASKIQSALLKAGHDPGPIDGVLGRQTHAAVKAFQAEKGLAQGGLTLKTLSSLGVMATQPQDFR